MFPLLGGVPTVAATAAMNGDALLINQPGVSNALLALVLIAAMNGDALLINQPENSAIVKVAEWCGNGYFRDEYGHCRPWYRDHETCPPGRHFEHWVYHTGGRCVPNY
jgi:hypothetical protein